MLMQGRVPRDPMKEAAVRGAAIEKLAEPYQAQLPPRARSCDGWRSGCRARGAMLAGIVAPDPYRGGCDDREEHESGGS